jgi:hypothetical protein
MKAIKNQGRDIVILAINPDEKSSHQIDTPQGKKLLYLPVGATPDGRLSNPTIGRVICSTRDIFEDGDMVVIHHNALYEDRIVKAEGGQQSFEKLYSIFLDLVFFIVRKGKYIPIWPFAIAQRCYYSQQVSSGGIILSFEKVQVKNRLIINELPDDDRVVGIKKEDVVVVFDKSDYACVFKLDNRITEVIRVHIDRDIIGIDRKMTSLYKKEKREYFDYDITKK